MPALPGGDRERHRHDLPGAGRVGARTRRAGPRPPPAARTSRSRCPGSAGRGTAPPGSPAGWRWNPATSGRTDAYRGSRHRAGRAGALPRIAAGPGDPRRTRTRPAAPAATPPTPQPPGGSRRPPPATPDRDCPAPPPAAAVRGLAERLSWHHSGPGRRSEPGQWTVASALVPPAARTDGRGARHASEHGAGPSPPALAWSTVAAALAGVMPSLSAAGTWQRRSARNCRPGSGPAGWAGQDSLAPARQRPPAARVTGPPPAGTPAPDRTPALRAGLRRPDQPGSRPP